MRGLKINYIGKGQHTTFNIRTSRLYDWPRPEGRVSEKPLYLWFWCPSGFRILKTIPTHSILWRKTKNWCFGRCQQLQLLWQTYTHTYIRTWRHYDDLDQRAESVKKGYLVNRSVNVEILTNSEQNKNQKRAFMETVQNVLVRSGWFRSLVMSIHLLSSLQYSRLNIPM